MTGTHLRGRWIAAAASAVAVALLVTGCGNERNRPAISDRPAPPRGQKPFAAKEAGVRLSWPASWEMQDLQPPGVLSVYSGLAVVAVWAYPRESLPRTRSDLEQARRLLVGEVRRRDRDFRLQSSRILRVSGFPAAQLVALQTVGKRRVRARSTHVYARDAEYVIDAYAAPAFFGQMDRGVFRPLLRRLRLTGRLSAGYERQARARSGQQAPAAIPPAGS